MEGIVYAISSKKHDKVYVGSTTNPEVRLAQHLWSIKRFSSPDGYQNTVSRHFANHKPKDLEFRILERVPVQYGGLHFSPFPWMALRFNPAAKRFVACPVRVKDIAKPHRDAAYPDKCKAKGCCAPVWECDIDGKRISTQQQAA